MLLTHKGAHPRFLNDPLVEWLLDSDPSIRWQVMRDLTDARTAIVAAERTRVAAEGWGALLLDQQRPDGPRSIAFATASPGDLDSETRPFSRVRSSRASTAVSSRWAPISVSAAIDSSIGC
jgi:hypothetical protein